MENNLSKKLALLKILEILQKYSDYDHPLTQSAISKHLENDFGLCVDRKTISRNISALLEAGIEIESTKNGCFLGSRDFEDSELRLLIDGILCSKYIAPKQSSDLINRICGLSNKYFKSHMRNIYTVDDRSKIGNSTLFLNIELIDEAIERGVRINYNFNKYGLDKKLHKSSVQTVTPYQHILHNQRYYLMAYSEYWGNMVYHRIDRITNMKLIEKPATPINKVPGFENGIDFNRLSSSMPYMYSDKPEAIEFLTDESMVDQIMDWFGTEFNILNCNDSDKIKIRIKASPTAMLYWALQYIQSVEIISPYSLREKIKETLFEAVNKYN